MLDLQVRNDNGRFEGQVSTKVGKNDYETEEFQG